MAKASWNGTVIAESDAFELVEGNVYFPESSVRRENLRPSTHQTVCPWKGTAGYYDVVVGDDVNREAAWYYATPSDAAKQIKGHIAFWKGVKVER